MEAAYSDDPACCLKNVYGQIEEVHYGYGNYYVYAAVVPDYKYIIISFRGSVTKTEVAEEAYYVLKQGQIPFGSGKVSTYFYNVTISLYNGIRNQFLAMKNNHVDYTILVTGHSLGGALAMVLSTYLRYYQIVAVNDILLITMGQPRVGDKLFAELHDRLLAKYNTFRITHKNDPVVHLPPLDDNSSFVGEYWHAGLEIFYPDSMGIGCPWTFCYLQDEDDACSDDTYGVENCLENCIISFFTTICILDCLEEFIDDHLYYFGRRVSSHCTTNETNGDANCYQSNPCPQNIEYEDSPAQYFKQTGYCYGVIYGTANLSDAEQQCKNYIFQFGHSTSVHSKAENEFITTIPNPWNETVFYYGIGYYFDYDSNLWKWYDNSTVDFINWNPGFPWAVNDTNAMCIQMNAGRTWNDTSISYNDTMYTHVHGGWENTECWGLSMVCKIPC